MVVEEENLILEREKPKKGVEEENLLRKRERKKVEGGNPLRKGVIGENPLSINSLKLYSECLCSSPSSSSS